MDISLGRYYKELDKIPLKKGETPSGVEFQTEMEIRTLFEQPDTATKKGVRDLLLMIMLYDTGARIQELLNVKICDVQFAKPSTLRVLGKGDKYRFIPVMPKTVEHLRRYLALFHPARAITRMNTYFIPNGEGFVRQCQMTMCGSCCGCMLTAHGALVLLYRPICTHTTSATVERCIFTSTAWSLHWFRNGWGMQTWRLL